jgi:hypothetical protein
MTSSTSQPITSTQRVYEAVAELRALEQHATRETVADLTGLKLTVVDDRLGALVDDGRLKRVLRGHYELVETFPPARDISKTILTDGRVKYEIGDDVLTLTPKEDRALSSLTAGAATQAIAIESSRQTSILVTELAAQLEKLKREHAALKAFRAQRTQLDLLALS